MADDPFASIAQPVAADDPFAAIATAETPAATPLTLKDKAKHLVASAGEGFGVTTPEQGKSFFTDPVGTAQGMLEAQGELGQQAVGEFKKGDYKGAIQHGAEFLLPGLGPVLAHSGKQLDEGDYVGGVGTLAGVGASLVLNPERLIGAAETGLSKVGQLRKTASEGIQPIARKVTGVETAVKEQVGKAADKQVEALADARTKRMATVKQNLETQRGALSDIERDNLLAKTKASQENAKAQQEHAVESQRVAEENKAAEHTLDLRKNTEQELQQKTDAYFAKEDAVKEKVKAANDEKWNAWREKIGDAEVDMQPVRDTIERVSASFPEVKQILKDTAPSESEMTAANQQYVSDRSNFMKQYGYGTDYETLAPERKTQVDAMMDRMGLHPEEGGVNIDAATPMSIKQLHDLKTQVGWKVFRHEYPPNVTGAMKQVLKSLDQAEARASIEHGAIDELESARRSHADYQDAFGRSKTKRSFEGEARKKGANPDAYTQKEEDSRLQAVAKHDPSLVDAHNELKGLREKLKGLPKEEALRKGIKQIPSAPEPVQAKIKEAHELPAGKPVPPLPEKPTVDLQRVSRDAIAQKAKNWGSFNARDIGILASGYLGGFLESLFHGRGLELPVAVTAYEGGKYAASRALNKPSVVKWLSQTPPGELEALRKIPGVDKVKVMNGLTQVAVDSANDGYPVHLSPSARQFLGPANIARIMAAQGVVAGGHVKNRKDAIDLLGTSPQ